MKKRYKFIPGLGFVNYDTKNSFRETKMFDAKLKKIMSLENKPSIETDMC